MLRTYIIVFVFAICTVTSFSQSKISASDVQIGTVLKIGSSETSAYKHIHFPKKNMIIKRGGIANYKKMEGLKTVVSSIEKRKDGVTIVKLKRKDGGRFFGSHTYVEATIDDALKSGELQAV